MVTNITSIRNTVAILNKSILSYEKDITSNRSLLKSLNTVLKKDGKDATVRLKNDHLKYGPASNFFKKILNGSRYASEREAAAKVMGVDDKVVSAETSIKTLQDKISDSTSNARIVNTIKAHCSNLPKLVNTGAQAWYTPSEKNITTYRGQGMRQSGIDTLITQFKKDASSETKTAYQLGQFFSTSTNVNVADDFANRSQDDVKVMFTVKGNSSNGLSIPGGLSFNNEGEKLYSPLANQSIADR